MFALVGVCIAILLGFYWAKLIYSDEHRSYDSWVMQGSATKPKGLSREEREIVFHETLRQYRRAFGLLSFAVAIGIILGAIIVGRLATAPKLDLTLLTQAVAIVSDLSLCGYARRVHSDAGKRLDKLITRFSSSGPST